MKFKVVERERAEKKRKRERERQRERERESCFSAQSSSLEHYRRTARPNNSDYAFTDNIHSSCCVGCSP